MPTIEKHPENVELQRRIKTLRLALADVLEEWEFLQSRLLPELRHKYDSIFGSIEITIQAKTLEEAELARLEELFRIKIERGEPLTSSAVTAIIEFVALEFKRLRKRMQAAKELQERRAHKKKRSASGHDAQEFPKLYREIVKKIHPDSAEMNATLFQKYWSSTRQAYETGNLGRLRSLYELICNTSDSDSEPTKNDLTSLRREKTALEHRIAVEQKKLSSLKTTEPFIFKGEMDKSEWIQSRRQLLEKEVAAIEDRIRRHTSFLDSLLGANWRTSPGLDENAGKTSDMKTEFLENTYLGGLR